MTTTAEFKGVAQADPPLRAPYNFVPLNAKVLPSPWPEGPDHGAPHKLGLCGALAVEWRLETPFLVGGRDNNSPFQLGDGGDYAIPGASLRGMIRSVLEILSYAHLGAYDDQRFSVRDYDAKTWQTAQKARGKPVTIRKPDGRLVPVEIPLSGWLSKSPDGSYHLTPCGQIDVPITSLAAALRLTKVCWDCTPLHNRHALLAANGLSGEIDLGRVSSSLAGRRGTLVVAGLIKSEVQRLAGGVWQETNKAKEVAFLATPGARRSWPISKEALKTFEVVQVKDGNDHPSPPVENWSFWKPKLEKGISVPVFYRGDPAAAAKDVPKPDKFFMALTRLMRVPHSSTVRDVLGKTQAALTSQLDFVEALFGRVPDEDTDKSVTKPQGRQRAWRSRVRFGMAVLTGDEKAVTLLTRQAVTMRPRPSFYPFYLRPDPKATAVVHPVDWSSQQAHLAGRKRYPPRNHAAELPSVESAARPQGRAEPPAQAEPAGAQRETRELENSLRFLDASADRPLVFRSTIRFHNLLPVELGGLIWAIGLSNPGGNENRRLRHMLGRGKAFGYGQLAAVIIDTDPATWIEANTGGDGKPLAAYADAFEEWALRELDRPAPFTALPEVAALLALCDADLGAELRQALTFPSAPPGAADAERILKAYSTIRKRSACAWTPDHTDRRAGSPVSADPGDPNRLLLPEYPLCREPER